MGAVLLQADDSEEARAAEEREVQGGKCEFDRTPDGLHLRQITFISRRTKTALEKSLHSYVGEAATIRWAVGQFRHYLFGATFTSLTDCSGLETFFENTEHASHVIQRWKAELLQFGMEIEHRGARMMHECDMLSRYNSGRVCEAGLNLWSTLHLCVRGHRFDSGSMSNSCLDGLVGASQKRARVLVGSGTRRNAVF